MNKLFFLLFCIISSIYLVSCNKDKEIPPPEYTNEFFQMPDEIYGGLYRELQLYEAVPHKDIADAIPLREPNDIFNDLRRARNDYDFDMKQFLNENFIISSRTTFYKLDSTRTIAESIDLLWEIWKKQPDSLPQEGSSLIPLRHPYVVEDDISNDVTYWNAYFTMVGLANRGAFDLVESMVNNFADLIDKFGFIPYNNRTYNTTKSHFPVFIEMVALLAEEKGKDTWLQYLPQIEKEYNYWMKNVGDLSVDNVDSLHVVRYQHYILNRFWDSDVTPRHEFYISDDRNAHSSEEHPGWMSFRDFRAITESGWNFSSRYQDNGHWRGSTMTIEMLPIDLNSSLFHYERTLSDLFLESGNNEKAKVYNARAEQRKEAILNVFWDDNNGIFKDVVYTDTSLMDRETMAMVYPLYFELVDQAKADSIALFVENKLLKEGGVVTTTYDSRQRWDAPNGWAHLHLISYKAFMKYGHVDLARKIATRWINTVEKTYDKSHRFLAYYNVEDVSENFEENSDSLNYSWTVGVYEFLKKEISQSK